MMIRNHVMSKLFVVSMIWSLMMNVNAVKKEDIPRASLPEMRKAPVIDGKIDENEWKDAVKTYGFSGHGIHRLTFREGIFWIGRKGDNYYLAIRTELPPEGLLARAKASKRDLRSAFFDDSIELVIDPKRNSGNSDKKYYHMIFNSNGALFDEEVDPGNQQTPRNFSWRIPDWKMKNSCHDGWWDIEMEIPISSFVATRKDLEHFGGFRLARNWKKPFRQSQWEQSAEGGYLAQKSMPLVRWMDQAPVVQILSLKEKELSVIKVKVANPTGKNIPVEVRIKDAWHSDQHQVLEKKLILKPDEEKVFGLKSMDHGPEGDHHTVITVKNSENGEIFYHRKFDWNLHRPKDVWQKGGAGAKKIVLMFKYYPYHSKIRAQINISGLKNKAQVKKAELRIINQRQPDKILWKDDVSFKKNIADIIADIPDLPDGSYQLQVNVMDAAGKVVNKKPVVQKFVRKHFEWEHNTYGICDEVMPPFTPIKNQGNKVETVLRTHIHNKTGFWKSVISKDKEILAGSMTLEAVVAGKKYQAEGKDWKVHNAKDTELEGKAEWSAGPLKGTLTTKYDYDGMMLCTLEIQPTEKKVDKLTLKIPVKKDIAYLMHAVTDGLRHHFSGKIPDGEGVIWDSTKANRIEVPGTFLPYIWIGGPERGICWFADTDKDWILDSKTPMLSLNRKGETVEMDVDFITRPGSIEKPHKIVFGLQVTPVKPMPEGWRTWLLQKKTAGCRPVKLIGHSMYWGGHYYLPYPTDKDFTFFDKIREGRETGKIKGKKEFIESWMKKVGRHIPEGSPYYKKIKIHIRSGLRTAESVQWKDGWRTFGYTNARGISFLAKEFPTFQDEWLRMPFFNRDWDKTKHIAYDAVPTKSLQDCVIWYYKKILECFDGIYWDNVYLSANFDPVVGGAWIDEEGEVHPGYGLFHLRDLIKRTNVFFWQQSKHQKNPDRLPYITMAHMTNTMIVPVLAFGNCNFDWEWRYGEADFQDRFSPDLTLTETIGRQVGAWPTILAGGHFGKMKDKKKLSRLFRTRLGVCLVHEIQPSDYGPKGDAEFYGKLYKFGYGKPECRVFNYWQEDNPVTVKGLNVKTLVLANNEKALIIVTSYDNDGECILILDNDKLGLPSKVSAIDFETGEKIAESVSGKIKFPLKKHDFRIIEFK